MWQTLARALPASLISQEEARPSASSPQWLPLINKSDAVLYPIDGRSGTGSLLSKDKVVRGAGTEPLDYGSDSSEDLLYTESGALDADGFRESCPRIVSYLKADAIRKKINVKSIFMGIL